MRAPGQGSTKRSTAGCPENYGDRRRIVVSFDEQMFTELRDRALREETSFAEQVRLLVKLGAARPVETIEGENAP